MRIGILAFHLLLFPWNPEYLTLASNDVDEIKSNLRLGLRTKNEYIKI